MGLRESFQQELHACLKAGETVKVGVIRLVIAEIKKLEISKRDIPDDDVIQIVRKQIKQRQESIAQFERGSRPDLVEREKAELLILERYLPQQMGDAELEALVKSTAAEMNAASKADMGKLMKAVIERAKGQADGKRISTIVNTILR